MASLLSIKEETCRLLEAIEAPRKFWLLAPWSLDEKWHILGLAAGLAVLHIRPLCQHCLLASARSKQKDPTAFTGSEILENSSRCLQWNFNQNQLILLFPLWSQHLPATYSSGGWGSEVQEYSFFLNTLFLRAVLGSQQPAEVQRFPVYLLLPHMHNLPTLSTSPTRWAHLLQLMNLHWYILSTQSPQFIIWFTFSIVYPKGLDKCIMTCIYCCSIIQSIFIALTILCSTYLFLCTSPTSGNHWSFYCLHSFAFLYSM